MESKSVEGGPARRRPTSREPGTSPERLGDASRWEGLEETRDFRELIASRRRFVVPATMKLGFILASCYFGGAIATELSHDALKVNPFIPIVLLWIGAFVRDRSIFF